MSTQISPIAQQEPGADVSKSPAFPARYAHFGVFQADLEREELYLDGQRVKVQAKIFRALLLLMSRAGEIVTREEVRRYLWPDTFLVNLDANVNTTMNKLRQVLSDAPESPRYVETIPRRGYSFIANIEYRDVQIPSSPEAVKPERESAGQAVASGSRWSKQLRMLARAASLVFAGMIVGALLAFVWFFAQAKSQRAGNSVKATACVVSLESGVPLKRNIPSAKNG